METLRRPLPTTFRINGSGRYAADLRDKLERDFFSHVVSQPALVPLTFANSTCLDQEYACASPWSLNGEPQCETVTWHNGDCRKSIFCSFTRFPAARTRSSSET